MFLKDVYYPLCFSPNIQNQIQSNSSDLSLIKYADDMALSACLRDSNSSPYLQYINTLTSWFDSNKDSVPTVKPISTKGQEVALVTQFKYLGTIIDLQLQFQNHVDYIYKKGRQCLALLRTLNTSQRTMTIVYKSRECAAVQHCVTVWAPLGQTGLMRRVL